MRQRSLRSENLGEALGAWADPLHLAVGGISDAEAAAEKAEVSGSTFGALASRFDCAAGAFAYLLFILLYFPCTAAIAAVHQESGTCWTILVAAWTTGLGYGLATIYYQGATWASHPGTSAGRIAVVLAAFAVALIALRRAGLSDTAAGLPVAQKG